VQHVIPLDSDQEKQARAEFQYVESPAGGRYYADWGDETRNWVNCALDHKRSVQLKSALLGLGLLQIICTLKAIYLPRFSDGPLHPSQDANWILLTMFATLAISAVSATTFPIAARCSARYGSVLLGTILLFSYADTLSLLFFYASLTLSAALNFSALAKIQFNARRAEAQSRLPLIDSPSPLSQNLVATRFYSGNLLYGDDLGWISFVDQFLHFQGTRTEFSLLAADVPLSKSELYSTLSGKSRSELQLSNSRVVQLTLKDGRDQETLLLEPLAPTPSEAREVLEEFKAKTVIWRTSQKTPHLVSTFPPRFASPDVVVETEKRIKTAQMSLKITHPLTSLLIFVEYCCFWTDLPRFSAMAIATGLVAVAFDWALFRQIRDGTALLIRENKLRLDRPRIPTADR
jgi:hypothetical protein